MKTWSHLQFWKLLCVLCLDLLIKEKRWKPGAVWSSQAVLMVKNWPDNAGDAGDPGSVPGTGGSPGGEHGNTLRILAWTVPWTEEAGGLQSMEWQRAGHDWNDLAHTQRNRSDCLGGVCNSTDRPGGGDNEKGENLKNKGQVLQDSSQLGG